MMVEPKTTPTKSNEKGTKSPATAASSNAKKDGTAKDGAVESIEAAGSSSAKGSPHYVIPKKTDQRGEKKTADITDDLDEEAAAAKEQSTGNSQTTSSSAPRTRRSARKH